MAYLVSAFEDLVYYVHEARVDQPRMRTAIYWMTIVLSLVKGEELGKAEYQREMKVRASTFLIFQGICRSNKISLECPGPKIIDCR